METDFKTTNVSFIVMLTKIDEQLLLNEFLQKHCIKYKIITINAMTRKLLFK